MWEKIADIHYYSATSTSTSMAGRTTLATHWMFTYNNPTHTQEEIIDLLTPVAKYAVFQLERGEDTHTPHYQGYVHFLKQQRVTSVTKLFQAHWEQMYKKSTPLACKTYCTKEDTREVDGGPWEIGTWTQKTAQGKRTDLDRFAKKAMKLTTAELFDKYPGHTLRYQTNVDKLKMKLAPKPQNLTGRCGIWLFGDTSTGKSEAARRIAEATGNGRYYDKLPSKWWDGYDGEDTVIIDDIGADAEWMAGSLKRFADKYPFPVEVKGSMLTVRPLLIICTSNYDLDEVFTKRQDNAAINDRFIKKECFHRAERVNNEEVELKKQRQEALDAFFEETD